MDSLEWQQRFKKCPQIVQEYFLDSQSGKNEDRAQELLALDTDAWDRVSDPAWVLIFDGMTKPEFREEVKKVAGEHNPDDIERVLLQYIVYPVADLVAWDVDARLQELGVPAAQIQSAFRISLRPMSYGAAARRIAINAKLSVLTEEVARRLREILVSYLKDIRTIEQVKQALQQSQAEGGVGFSREQADRYVEEMQSMQMAVRILSEQEYADWYANFQREATAKLLDQPLPSQGAADQAKSGSETVSPVIGEGDTVPVVRRTIASDDYDGLLEAAVEDTTQKLSVTGLDEYLLKRLRNIISTRLRDVRNAIQVKEVLVRDSKVGGLDRHPEEADAMVKVIEESYQAHRSELMAAEQQRIEKMKQAQDQKRDERRKQESEAHADWYRQKVQEANPWAAALQAQSQQSAVPGAPASAAAPVWPAPAASSNAPANAAPPAIDSIRPPMRLTSLGSELAGVTLAEFRRMARTPEEATERIWQKLETLKQESYDRWQEGAQAWRQSPLQQQYLQIVAQSFTSGRPVAEIARELHEQDPNQPTAEEIGAILLINNRLHV